MCPEYGAIVGYFAADEMLIQHLINTGRKKETVEYIREYLKAVKLIRDYNYESANNDDNDRKMFTEVYELDLSTVLPCVSGPKRPMDKTVVSDLKESFKECLTNKNGFNVSLLFLKLVLGKTVQFSRES
jgi:aconitate hydratase